ncbi:type II RES/Xre toxin-antitoxin system antitoxin [Pseudomonas sp. LB3P14]
MGTSPATRRPAKKQAVSREEGIAAFWRFSSPRQSLTDSERLQQIKVGFPADLIQALRLAFDLQDRHLETLLHASISTLERRRREQKNLDPVASERLDRVASVSHLTEGVFDNPVRAVQWMSMPNKALGGIAPIMLCETEIGAKQVRRILQTLEWGGAA